MLGSLALAVMVTVYGPVLANILPTETAIYATGDTDTEEVLQPFESGLVKLKAGEVEAIGPA